MSSARFLKNVTIVATRLGLGAILGLGITSFLARVFGPASNGIYAMAVLIPTTAVILGNLGIGASSIYFISSSKYSVSTVTKNNLLFSSIAAILAALASALFILLDNGGTLKNLPVHVLMASVATIFPMMLFGNLSAVYTGVQNFRAHGILTLLPQMIFGILLATALPLFANSLTGALSLFAMAYMVAVVILLTTLKEHLLNYSANRSERTVFIRDAMSYGIKAHLGNVITFLNYRVDVFLLTALVDIRSVGLYAITVPITEAIWMTSTAVSAVIFPWVASQTDKDDLAQKGTALVCRWVFTATVISALIIGVLAETIVMTLFGVEYKAAVSAIWFLLPGVSLWSIARVLSNDMAGRGRTDINLALSCVALIINVLANLILIPRFAINGAAIASSVSYSALTVCTMLAYSRLTQCPFWQLLIPTSLDVSAMRMLVSRILTKTI